MTVWLTIVVAACGTYALRISMVVLASRAALPSIIERAARGAVPPVFAALIAAGLVRHIAADVAALPPFAAIAVGVVAVRRTGSPTAALLAGMPTMWLLSALIGA